MNDPCEACGACCIADSSSDETFVDILEEDYERLPDELRGSAVYRGDFGHGDLWQFKTRYNLQGLTVCFHLKGTVGVNAYCSIYNDRPGVCRIFEPDSEECSDAIGEFRRIFEV